MKYILSPPLMNYKVKSTPNAVDGEFYLYAIYHVHTLTKSCAPDKAGPEVIKRFHAQHRWV